MKRRTKSPSVGAQGEVWDCATQGSTVTLNPGGSRHVHVKATTANVVFTTPIMQKGQDLDITFEQDAVGGRTISLGGQSGVVVGGGALTPAAGANELSVYRLRCYRTGGGGIVISKQIV